MRYIPTFAGPAVLTVGSMDIGFRFYGPFVDAAAATLFVDYLLEHDTGFAVSDDRTWIMPLQSEESVRRFYAEQEPNDEV